MKRTAGNPLACEIDALLGRLDTREEISGSDFANVRQPGMVEVGFDRMRYVCGFMFDTDLRYVLLIRKNRPAWQAGLLNGIGGKIEPGETARRAMAREMWEEAIIYTHEDEWGAFHIERFANGNEVHYMLCPPQPLERLQSATQATDEELCVFRYRSLRDPVPPRVVHNLHYLLPMAVYRMSCALAHRPVL